MVYCDYNYYKNKYSGTLPETTFNRLAIQASAEIRKNTFDRIKEDNIVNEVKNCVCELVEYIEKIEKQEGKKSESVGKWNVTYAEKTEIKQSMYGIIKKHLSQVIDSSGTSLIYRGV